MARADLRDEYVTTTVRARSFEPSRNRAPSHRERHDDLKRNDQNGAGLHLGGRVQ